MFNLKCNVKLVDRCTNCHAGILENEEGERQCTNNYTHCDYSNKLVLVNEKESNKVGVTYAEIQRIYSEKDSLNNSHSEKSIFESIVGISPDDFAKLYQEGIINTKENMKSLSGMINDMGLEETMQIFKAKK